MNSNFQFSFQICQNKRNKNKTSQCRH